MPTRSLFTSERLGAVAERHSPRFAGVVGGECKGGLALPVPLRGSPVTLPHPVRHVHCVGQRAPRIGYTISSPSSESSSPLPAPTNEPRFIVQCHIAEACVGGPESLCADGYTARRCGRCTDGWYSYVGSCKTCGTSRAVLALNVAGAIIVFLLGLFILWQLLLDPRVASPFGFLMRLMETLAILNRTGLEWPPAARDAFSLASLVNFNTEIFRFECSLGHPEPHSRVVTALIFPIGAALVFILAWPLIRLVAKVRGRKHPVQARTACLELMYAMLRPDAPPGQKHGRLELRPTEALAAASWVEFTRIIAAVSAPSNVSLSLLFR